jgi:hypothetical protein
MWCADIVRSQHAPFRIVPRFGQLPEYRSKVLVSKETWDVFQECEGWSHFANDADGFRPEVSLVVLSLLFAGDAERLAWESRSDDIHDSTPPLSVKGSHVVPDREQVKYTVPLASEEHFSSVRLFFHGADGSPPEQLAPEQPATSSGKKCQLIHLSPPSRL